MASLGPLPSEASAERLKDRWQDLCAGVDSDQLSYDEAVVMYESMRDTPRVIEQKRDY